MITKLLISTSSFLGLLSYIIYAQAILKKEARPHRTTRFVIFLTTLIPTLSLFAQGNTVAIWLTGIFTIGSFLILILSLKYGMGGWAKTDIICLIISLIGIVLWKVTSNPVLALYFSILADFTGVIPTLIKTYKYPKTEIARFFLIDVISAFLNFLANNSWSIENIAYPLYIMIIDSLIIFLIKRPIISSIMKNKLIK